MTALLVAVGGALGAALRYALDVLISAGNRTPMPLGTLAANVLGALVLGLVTGAHVSPAAAALLATGFCGALTTYSTFAVENARLGRARQWGVAAAYGLGTLVLGVAAACAGYAAGRAL